MLRKSVHLLIFSLASSVALAWPTSLNVIPIADVIKHKEVQMGYSATGNLNSDDKSTGHTSMLLFGFEDRFEIGVDTNMNGYRSMNFKILLLEEQTESKYMLSAGVQEWSEGYAEPYVVGALDLTKARVHAGWLKNDAHRLIVGLEVPINKDWYLLADFISGREGASWIGVYGPLLGVSGFDITIGIGRPHDFQGSWQWMSAASFSPRL